MFKNFANITILRVAFHLWRPCIVHLLAGVGERELDAGESESEREREKESAMPTRQPDFKQRENRSHFFSSLSMLNRRKCISK